MRELIVIIATKNRNDLLKNAVESVYLQTRKPNEVIIVSDSDYKDDDKKITEKYDFTFLENKRTRNYAGNLNTAIDYVVKTRLIDSQLGVDDTFIAFLDDDDIWDPSYLQKCWKARTDKTDFVVAGINYIKDESNSIKLSCKEQLSINDFLRKNPHIQGSNTFVRLTTLLKAGCFDEDLSSTTDRDVFSRIMMLEPKYSVINESLVNVDASNNRTRLTNNIDGKKESLSKFYSKYECLMSDDDKKYFFKNINEKFGLNEEKLQLNIKKYNIESENDEFCVSRKIVFAFISTSEHITNKMISEIQNFDYPNKSIICFANYINAKNYNNENLKILSLNDVYNCKSYFVDILKKEYNLITPIKDIPIARTILNIFLKEYTLEEDVIWILDDDMELKTLCYNGYSFCLKEINISNIVNKYKDKYDAVIGSYSNKPPLPLLSTLRTNLLDYVYNCCFNKKNNFDNTIFSKTDYYYDLTDSKDFCLETPVKITEKISLDDIFNGTCSRKLFSNDINEFEPNSRGGNTLIFNHKLLDIPNVSINLGNITARRGDFFWVQLAQEKGFNIIGSSFSTYHNREPQEFNYNEEIEKLLKDIIGSSFTKAFNKEKNISRTSFREKFINNFKIRLVKFIENYYRIIGLLKICKDSYYLQYFTENNLNYFINKCIEITQNECLIEASLDNLKHILLKNDNLIYFEKIKRILDDYFNSNLSFLGVGGESIVFSDKQFVYKFFIYEDNDNLKFLKSIKEILKKSLYFDDITFYNIQNHNIIKYPYHKFETYTGGHALECAEILNYLKNNNIVLTNIKSANFILVDGKLKFIDYGKNLEPYSKSKFERSVERMYQMIKFGELSELEFKQIISKSYKNQANCFNFGIEAFKLIVENKLKEDIHDKIVIDIINKTQPRTLLDYGAGKCKIVNHFSNSIMCSVFDIDTKILNERKNNNVTIINDIEKENTKFDFINCNLVLCCTDTNINHYILSNINRLIADDGIVLISICNPFFDDVNNTTTRREGLHEQYDSNIHYNKKDIYRGREEYHRTIDYYKRLFFLHNLELVEIKESSGVNADTLNFISEQIFFICKKSKIKELTNCSLLIKTNSMEYNTIYSDIKHIVSQLEKADRFFERVVVVDSENNNRLRKYNDNNRELLLKSLQQLKDELYIDRIVFTNDNQIFSKYYTEVAKNNYSQNGQPILSILTGLDSIKTPYVLQTDSDIIYYNNEKESISYYLNIMEEQKAVISSLSIAQKEYNHFSIGDRSEIRTSIICLSRLREKTPFINDLNNDQYKDAFHRTLDKQLQTNEILRFYSPNLFFIHPENNLKNIPNYISYIKQFIENNNIYYKQYGNVNLVGSKEEWAPNVKEEMVIFIRGKNTPPEKLFRLFNSLKKQTYQNFKIIYIDDASIRQSSDYANFIFKYDKYFKDKVIGLFNNDNVGSLCNFEFTYKNIIKNPQSIIVNIDNDDCLLDINSLQIIKDKFDSGYDVTVGNCFRVDKPLKKYKVISFSNVHQRDGDNVWLHPKCFRRYLCEYIKDNLKDNGNYYDVATDYAIMLPIIEHCKKPLFIDKFLYYFEPSIENVKKINNYSNVKVKTVHQKLFTESEKRLNKKTIAIIGDGNVNKDSKTYQLAFNVGKILIDNGYIVKNGGLGGVMEASAAGAKSSLNGFYGCTIGISPFLEYNQVNKYIDIEIPTNKDILRNKDVIDADAVIVIGGGAGTLSELAFAWSEYKLIIAFNCVDGVSKEFADKKIDSRIRYSNILEDRIFGVSNEIEMIDILNKYINIYTHKRNFIRNRKDFNK